MRGNAGAIDRELFCIEKGDELEAVWYRYSDMLYEIAFNQMHDRAEAKAVIHMVFKRLLREKASLLHAEYLKVWLVQVTKNCCYIEAETLAHICMDCSAWESKVLQEEIRQPEKTVEDQDWNQWVWSKAIELKEMYRDVIYLFYFKSYSIQEMSRILGVCERTARTRLNHARKCMRSLIIKDSKKKS